MRLAETDSPRYEAAVRHFVVYFIQEFEPKPLQIRRLADCFECLGGHLFRFEALEGLDRLAAQIKRYEEGREPGERAVDFAFEGQVERAEGSFWG